MNNVVKLKIGDYAYHRPTNRIFRITGFDKDHDPHARFFNGGIDTFWLIDVRPATKDDIKWYVKMENASNERNEKCC